MCIYIYIYIYVQRIHMICMHIVSGGAPRGCCSRTSGSWRRDCWWRPARRRACRQDRRRGRLSLCWLLRGVFASTLKWGERGRDFGNPSDIEMSVHFQDTGRNTHASLIVSVTHASRSPSLCLSDAEPCVSRLWVVALNMAILAAHNWCA